MIGAIFRSCKQFASHVKQSVKQWTRPINDTLVLSTALDLTRSRADLIVENALLRQQLIVLRRQVKRPQLTKADRIRLVLLARCTRLGIQVSKRTVQKYMVKERRASGQTWATFLKNHAGDIWACDFTVVHDLLFRPLYILVILELKTRRVVHTAVTISPTDRWTAQQLRETTPWGEAQVPDSRSGQQVRPAVLGRCCR